MHHIRGLQLQFILEIGGDRLNFLNVTIINGNDILEFNEFHKPTFSGRYLSFFLLHPLPQKRSILMNVVDKMISSELLLSHPKFHENNLRFIVNTFLENDDPMKFIFDTLNFRLRFLHKI